MKVVFFGTSDYCLPILESLHKNFELCLVITRPDKPIGRDKKLTPSATKVWAMKNGIEIFTPETLKKDSQDRLEILARIKEINPDLAVVSDFGLIIPEAIFNLPRLGTLNIHFSKLPDLRGPSPVQFTLLRGDKNAWVTIFKLENPPELEIKMDSGPIVFQQSFLVLPNDTTATLYTRLFEDAGKFISDILNSYIKNPNSLENQDHKKVTFCRFLAKDDGFIEWSTLNKAINGEKILFTELSKIQQESIPSSLTVNSEPVYSFYRAVTPWPGMWSVFNGRRIKILQCHLQGEKLILDLVQFEGKNPIRWQDVIKEELGQKNPNEKTG